MAHPVLNEDWSDYDNRKITDGRDRSKFSCEESLEVDYLVRKLQKHYPYTSASSIRAAINSCCSGGASRVREDFVDCVTGKL